MTHKYALPPLTEVDETQTMEVGTAQQAEEDVRYVHCCSGTVCDTIAIRMLVLIIMSVGLMTFCVIQLVLVDKCDNEIYVSMMTMAISIWIPVHKMIKD